LGKKWKSDVGLNQRVGSVGKKWGRTGGCQNHLNLWGGADEKGVRALPRKTSWNLTNSSFTARAVGPGPGLEKKREKGMTKIALKAVVLLLKRKKVNKHGVEPAGQG